MNIRVFAPFLLTGFLLVAVLGMPLVLAGPTHHEAGCPFAIGQAALCATSVFEHVKHWQIAFATILAELLIAAALLYARISQWGSRPLSGYAPARIRVQGRAPHKPTFMQELFSRGILHTKVF